MKTQTKFSWSAAIAIFGLAGTLAAQPGEKAAEPGKPAEPASAPAAPDLGLAGAGARRSVGPDGSPLAGGKQGGPRPREVGPEVALRVFALLDLDKDGRLSHEEAPQVIKDGFGKLDRNSDGYLDNEDSKFGRGRADAPAPGDMSNISSEDRDRMRERMRGAAEGGLISLDTNKDGKVDANELPPHLKGLMKRMDANNNGTLEGDELKMPRAPRNGLGRVNAPAPDSQAPGQPPAGPSDAKAPAPPAGEAKSGK